MSGIEKHPEDFSPILDHDLSDPRYEELSLHLDRCSSCADEIRELRALEASFRSPDLEIDVPAFQWQRIQARLAAGPPKILWWRQRALIATPRRLALNLAFGTALVLAIAVSGVEYRRYVNGQQLMAIASYSQVEQNQLDNSDNPFSHLARSTAGENPFAHFQNSLKDNPFAVR